MTEDELREWAAIPNRHDVAVAVRAVLAELDERRAFSSRAGKARAANLTPKRRSEDARRAARVRWDAAKKGKP